MSVKQIRLQMHFPPRRLFIIIGGIICVVVVAATIYFSFFNKNKPTPQQELVSITTDIGKFMVLPSEQPVLATVTDKSKLPNQSFFQQAESGDKVLIYGQAKKVILYRPSSKKVIDIVPLLVEQQKTETPSKPLTISIYNGTNIIGYASSVEKQLKEKIDNIEILAKSNAKNDYTQTIVIDLKGTNKQAAELLAKILNGTVSSLPEGEAKPVTADFLIILGHE